MIPAAQLELITAAVDGELSARESRALRRLLESSSDARAVYATLTSDRDRVRSLPRAVPPADLRARILARVATATPAPKRQIASSSSRPTRAAVPYRRVRELVPIAVAASLFMCVAAGSFAYFTGQNPSRSGATAKGKWSSSLPAPDDSPTAVPSPTEAAPQENARPDPRSVVRSDLLPVPHDPLPPPKVVAPGELARAPEPRPLRHDLMSSQILPPLRPFEFVRARVPFLRTVAELAREDIRQELIDDLGREPAARLDLFVRSTALGSEAFQAAAKAAGVTVFADATTLDRLKKGHVASVVVYTENLTAAELATFLGTLSEHDAKFSPRVCDSLHVSPIGRSDENELAQVLGIDAGLFKRAVGSNGSGPGQAAKPEKVADPKPISAGTIDSVVQSVTSSAPKPVEKTAVLMTWQTTHPAIARTLPGNSAELKQFLARRGDRKPNAIPVVVVIRPVG
jgi:hypothetical protein